MTPLKRNNTAMQEISDYISKNLKWYVNETFDNFTDE